MTCTHDIIEKDNACADGMCPICLAAELDKADKENDRLRDEIDTCRELRKYDRIEIERLRILMESRT